MQIIFSERVSFFSIEFVYKKQETSKVEQKKYFLSLKNNIVCANASGITTRKILDFHFPVSAKENSRVLLPFTIITACIVIAFFETRQIWQNRELKPPPTFLLANVF